MKCYEVWRLSLSLRFIAFRRSDEMEANPYTSSSHPPMQYLGDEWEERIHYKGAFSI